VNLDPLEAFLSCTKLEDFAFSIFCPNKPAVDGALLQAMTLAWPLLGSLYFQWCLGEVGPVPEDDDAVISSIKIPQTSFSSRRTVSRPMTATRKVNDTCQSQLDIYVPVLEASGRLDDEAEDVALFFSLLWPGREIRFCGIQEDDSEFWDEVEKLVHFERRFLLRYLGQDDQ